MFDGGRLRVHYLQVSECGGRAGLFFNAELDQQRLAAFDREQVESASLVAEPHHGFDCLVGVECFDVRLDFRAVAAIEGIEPRLQGLPSRCTGDGGLAECTPDDQEQQHTESTEHAVWTYKPLLSLVFFGQNRP
jgi:hypothetical protein